MMKEKHLTFAVVVLILLLLIFLALNRWLPAVSDHGWDKLKIGMTQEQVEDLIGPPNRMTKGEDGSESWWYQRIGSEATAEVHFTPAGTVYWAVRDDD